MAKTYKCLVQVYVDSLYLPNETVELTEEQALALAGKVELVTTKAAEVQKTKPTKTVAE